jgi:hypothetical protein
MTPHHHLLALGGTALAITDALTDILPQLASIAAVFSGFAAGCYYARKLHLSFRDKQQTKNTK